MKRKFLTQLTAAGLSAVMVAGLVGCGSSADTTTDSTAADSTAQESTEADTTAAETTEDTTAEAETEATETEEPVAEEEEVSPYEVLTDADGNPYDLGGMEIIVRDWWSSGEEAEPTSDYEEARLEYREWLQETYNFTLTQVAISDWGSTPSDFVEYATTGGDENYIWILRDDPATTSAMATGLMYDLSTLDCLDFSEDKFQENKLHEQYSIGDSVYAMYAGKSEPRTGLFFNKRILEEAGIDPESIYDMQADGTWTWDAWLDIMDQVQRDVDNDGVIDIYGVTMNNSSLTNASVFSNGGEYVGKADDGSYVLRLTDAETVEGLDFALKVFQNYTADYGADAQWDAYKEGFNNGVAAFMVEDQYCANPGGFINEMEDDFGFVMFPKGNQLDHYVNCWSNNPVAIPSCYDEQKAWNLAFAWNLWNDPVPGYEDYDDLSAFYTAMRDTRSVDETIVMMRSADYGMITYDGMIPNLQRGNDFTYSFGSWSVVSESVDAIKDTWQAYVDAANGN